MHAFKLVVAVGIGAVLGAGIVTGCSRHSHSHAHPKKIVYRCAHCTKSQSRAGVCCGRPMQKKQSGTSEGSRKREGSGKREGS